jgi:hypothetical protein
LAFRKIITSAWLICGSSLGHGGEVLFAVYKVKLTVALRVEPEALEKYKALGEGYIKIMADVLNYVANNPEILSKAFKTIVT